MGRSGFPYRDPNRRDDAGNRRDENIGNRRDELSNRRDENLGNRRDDLGNRRDDLSNRRDDLGNRRDDVGGNRRDDGPGPRRDDAPAMRREPRDLRPERRPRPDASPTPASGLGGLTADLEELLRLLEGSDVTEL